MLFRRIQNPVISFRSVDSISVQHLSYGQARTVIISNSAPGDPPDTSGDHDEDDGAADKAPLATKSPQSPKAVTIPSAIGLSADWKHLDISLFQNGALLIDKPLEWTSFDVCGKLRNSLRFLGVPKALKVGEECCCHAAMQPCA